MSSKLGQEVRRRSQTHQACFLIIPVVLRDGVSRISAFIRDALILEFQLQARFRNAAQAPHFLWSSFGWGLSLSSPECNSGYFPTSMETQGIGQQVRLSVFFSWVGTCRPRYDFFIFSFLYVCQLWHSASLVGAIGTKSRSCGPIQPLYGKAPHMLSAP